MQHSRSLFRMVCVVALLCVVTMPSAAQETQPTDQQPDSAAQAAPENGGLLQQLGKLLKSPADLLPSLSKTEAPAQQTLPLTQPPAPTVAAPVTPVETPSASPRLFPGMVTGREVCPRASNGAPDCQAGTDKLCQSKGYKSGKSLNTDSAFSCSARQARAEGGKPCGNEHFVTSAFCN